MMLTRRSPFARRMAARVAAFAVALAVGAAFAGCKRRPRPSPPGPLNIPAPPAANAPTTGARPSVPPEAEKLAFAAKTDGGFEVRVANADGSGSVAIGATAPDYPFVLWSPDGTRLSFVSKQGAGRWLILATPDGKTKVKLGDAALTAAPSEQWGEGGAAIAAVCGGPSGIRLHVFPADGSSSQAIDIGVKQDEELDFWDYSWCGNQPRLAFDHLRGEGDSWCRISIADLTAGTVSEVAAKLPGVCLEPSWSPDGEHLVFFRKQGDEPAGLYVSGADGQEPTLISESCDPPGREHWWPVWSPDGRKLAFDCEACPKLDVPHCHVVDLRGRLLAHIEPSAGCSEPQWSPDGRRILVSMGEGIPGAGIYDLEAGSFGTVGDALVRGVLLARWAPDSTHVLLVGDADQTGVVGIASADDKAFNIVSGGVTNVVDAAWSPSGERLLLVAASPQSSDLGTLYTVAASGTGMKKVHAGLIAATSATWQPQGR